METVAQCGPSGDSTEDGLEMVTHTQHRVATGAWVEQAGMMTVSLRSILCGGDKSLWSRNKGGVFLFLFFFSVGFVCMCVFQSFDRETNVFFVTVTVQ